jgi:uncharacterized membrane protein YhaH (DUF805 family)
MYDDADLDALWDEDGNRKRSTLDDLKALLFGFDGRIDNVQFLLGYMLVILLSVLGFALAFGAALVLYALGAHDAEDPVFLLGVLTVACVQGWAGIALQVKRLHDLGQSGWWVLLNGIPYIGGPAMLVWLLFAPGTPGRNAYGGRSVGGLRPSSPYGADLDGGDVVATDDEVQWV